MARPGRYLGPDYGEEHSGPQDAVVAAQLPNLARQSFPLCMQVRRDGHASPCAMHPAPCWSFPL